MTDDAQLAALARVLRHLLLASYHLYPDDLAKEVRLALGHLGATDTTLLLCDYYQEHLVGFEPSDDQAFRIDDPGPGQAFRDEVIVEERAPDGRRRLWIPTKDSAHRLGVVGVVDDGTVPLDCWETVGSLIGELIVSKASYGDRITLRKRQVPFSLAAEMRWSLLPPLTFTGPEAIIAGLVQPPHGIAGDAFDYSVTGRTASMLILDAVGHGLEACRMANLAVGTYRNSRRAGAGPVDTLHDIDRTIAGNFGESGFVTVQIGQLDFDSGRLEIANAGHPSPLLLRKDEAPVVIACAPARPAGLGVEPAVVTVELEPHESVLFRSDGIIEARSPDGEPFGEERLASLVASSIDAGLTPAEVLRHTMKAVVGHKAERTGDDATLLLVRWMGKHL